MKSSFRRSVGRGPAYVNTGKISASDVAALRGAVHAVKGSIGTYNRFLEWWPLGF